MFRHYVIVAIRLIKRSFLFSSLNMLGFVLGMTAAFLIYLWVMDELTYEDFHQNRDQIYRVITEEQKEDGQIEKSPSTVMPLCKAFREEFPQIENATSIKYLVELDLHAEENRVEVRFAYVDTAFFDVFSFPVIAGDPTLMKRDPQQIVLSEATAQKLFGKTSPVGKEVECRFFGAPLRYKVAAVLKVPRKSHIRFDLLLSEGAYFEPMGWDFSEGMHTYVQLKKGISLPEIDRQAMSRLWMNHWDQGKPLVLQPLGDVHLHTDFKDPGNDTYGSILQIYLFLALAVLIVFMGAFNFTTLSTARASLRFKEIGVRKVTGAKRKTLVMQFLSESLIQAFLSLLLALALTELLLPFFNSFVGKDIVLQLNWQTLLFILFGIVGVGCLAGAFPAFYMSSFNPLLAFKGGRTTGKKGGLIKALVCVQFVIAIVMIVCTSVVFRQLHYLQNTDLGFEKENVVVADCKYFVYSGLDNYKQEVRKNPNVLSVASGIDMTNYLQGYISDSNTFGWMNEAGQLDSLKMVCIGGDSDFMNTLKLTLLSGELFDADPAATYVKESPIVINETARKMLGVKDPVGMILQNRGWFGETSRIVGVVKDFNYQPLREKIEPAFLFYHQQMRNTLYIKIAAENKAETLKFLKAKYEEMRPNNVFTYRFFTDALNLNYAREQQQSRMFLIFTVLAIVIAMIGVFGLVTLSAAQRTKEIGVRKVNGAHSVWIVRMFCLEYIRWVGIAFVIACPLAYLVMDRWLSNFAYRIAIDWWLFPISGLIIMLITVITVEIQTWRAASRNPVRSLRYE